MKNTDLSVKILLRKCLTEIMEKLVQLFYKISIKSLCLYLVQHMLHKIKAQQFYNDLGLYQMYQNLQKIVEFKDFFKAFE